MMCLSILSQNAENLWIKKYRSQKFFLKICKIHILFVGMHKVRRFVSTFFQSFGLDFGPGMFYLKSRKERDTYE